VAGSLFAVCENAVDAASSAAANESKFFLFIIIVM
jgi:hypothetical protein